MSESRSPDKPASQILSPSGPIDDKEAQNAVKHEPKGTQEEMRQDQSSDIDSKTNAHLNMALESKNDLSAAAAQQAQPSPTTAPATVPREEPGPEFEPRIPNKKDATLREFLGKMDDYAPIIPDAVTNYYLTLAGLPPPPHTPPHLARLLALATQKFMSDIAADAYQFARIRSSHTTSNTAAAQMGIPGAVPGLGIPGAAPAGVSAAKEDGKVGATGGAGGGKGGLALGMQRPGFGGGGQGTGQGRTVLTMEDLGMAVGEYGINVKRGEFYR